MQWILQDFEDTRALARALDRLGLAYSLHKVVPFVGALVPEPVVADGDAVVLFGSYSLWRYAEAKGLRPGVFRLAPFVDEPAWRPYLLNGPDALFLALRDLPARLADDGRRWFVRPREDGKEMAGRVMTSGEIAAMAGKVLALDDAEIPDGALRHDTAMMLAEPVRILREWRLWAVDGRIVTWSLYREGARVVYRPEIDDDALAFASRMVDLAPGHARAYVLDVCRTEDGLRLLETNCLNAAGFYAADLVRLAMAIEGLGRG
ncbi:MAG: ATP-grasp domain-containing protein [Paracoccaceae bacterium]